MDNKTLARLVERARQGQGDAFAVLYSEFSKPVYYTALKITKNAQDAADVVQETLTKLFQNLNTLKNQQALVAYVNRIAYNASLQILKKSGRVSAVDDWEDWLPDSQEENASFLPAECLENKEMSRLVMEAVDDLGEDQRTAVLLFYFQRLSTKEIAGVSGVSETVVQKRLSRARANIKEKLANGQLMGAVMVMMNEDILTKLLNAEADRVFTETVSQAGWIRVAENLGLPAAVIGANTMIATTSAVMNGGAVSTIATTSAGLTGWVGTKLLAAAAAVVLVAGGTTATMVPGPVHDYVQEYVNMEGSPLAFLQDIFPDVPPSAGIDISPITPIPPSPSVPPDGKAPSSGGSDPSGHTPETPGATTPADPSASAEPSQDPVQSPVWEPSLSPSLWPVIPPRDGAPVSAWQPTAPYKVLLMHSVLTYRKGEVPAQAKMIDDLGVAADVQIASVQLGMVDLVDFDVVGKYAVYVYVTDVDGNRLPVRAAIIVIAE